MMGQSFVASKEKVTVSGPGEVIANIAIGLSHQANYLIDQQLRRLDKDFTEQGGSRERILLVQQRASPQKILANARGLR
jgi:four helix bundle suffix protein